MHRISWLQFTVLAVMLAAALAAWITTKTKRALLTTAGVSGMAINVDTVFGRVTLHDKVRSAEEQAKAETVAQQINGVQGVRAVQDDLRLTTATH